jgi:anti-sigma regulatory factor (Ser/Thr protein kinase)
MCWTSTTSYLREVSAPGAARKYCVEQLTRTLNPGQERDEVAGEARLIVSELVTNSVAARSTRVGLSIEFHAAQLRISVSDDAAGVPHICRSGPTDLRGRGLAIVQATASRWGVTPTYPSGKQVWADLLFSPGLAPDRFCALRPPLSAFQ